MPSKFSFAQHVHARMDNALQDSAASTAEQILAESSIQELLVIGSDFLIELVDLYIDDTSERVRRTAESFAAGDPREVGREAHALKSASANMGALPFSGVCAELELLGNHGDLSSMEPWMGRLNSMHSEVKLALIALRATYQT